LISIPSTSSCIHVIDGALPIYAENEPLLTQLIAEHSHVDRIISSGTSPIPSQSIFGAEPTHDWCYYYQKASLARQQGNWEEVNSLYNEAISLGFKPNDKSEIIPFIEALVNIGKQEEALELYNKELKGFIKIRFPLCKAFDTNRDYNPAPAYNAEKIYQILCNS
jgi:pentatricopeptide repeat protein